MGKLDRANDYVREHHQPREALPVFHAAPPVGWMNDPNGFSIYQGRAHLFYQHHPYNPEWGPMHWGHCVSDDFIKWEDAPIALAPGQEYDAAGCFSGTGLETEQGHLLVYTGVIEEEENGGKKVYQNQCLAIGDGIHYNKSENNPVVTGDMMPENFSRADFRDPKIWKEEDGYYMLVGNTTADHVPQAVLFRSENLTDWSYVSVFARDEEGRFGTNWECPDFFELDGQQVLVVSPQDMRADDEFHSGNNAAFFLGEYEKQSHQFHYHEACSLDYGLDFYAPQTLKAADGRRIMIAWMQSWDAKIFPASQKWAGMMTIPRELRMEDGKLMQTPVREIGSYHTQPVSYERQEIAGMCQFPGMQGRVADIDVEILSGEYKRFVIHFAHNAEYDTMVAYDKEEGQIEIDRTHAGLVRDVISQRKMKLKYPKETLRLRLILDKYSAELFVNDGEQVFSMTFYTPMEADEICFECDGNALVNIQKYTISLD